MVIACFFHNISVAGRVSAFCAFAGLLNARVALKNDKCSCQVKSDSHNQRWMIFFLLFSYIWATRPLPRLVKWIYIIFFTRAPIFPPFCLPCACIYFFHLILTFSFFVFLWSCEGSNFQHTRESLFLYLLKASPGN